MQKTEFSKENEERRALNKSNKLKNRGKFYPVKKGQRVVLKKEDPKEKSFTQKLRESKNYNEFLKNKYNSKK